MIGTRVRVVVPPGLRDPWIADKDGWEGRVLAPVSGLDDHYQVMFLQPWCPLKIARIMPASVLRAVKVVTAISQRRLPL